MVGKLLLIIVATGAVSLALLVNRQQRIEAAHQMARAHQRLNDFESLLWTMRRDITVACHPETLRGRLAEMGHDWRPIPCEPTPLREREDEPPPIQLVRHESRGPSDSPDEGQGG